MESENVINNINLSINFLRNLEGLDKMNDKIFEFSQTKNFKDFLSGKLEDEEERIEIFNKIIELARDQLKQSSTVGEILDIMKFSVQMLVVEKKCGETSAITTNDVLLLNEIFMLLPEQWCHDPVKIHLITKVVYETLVGDFNNTIHVLNKIITINKLGFYVALTLFWALYLSFFKKDSHHYYKMYDRNKFFKLLLSLENKEMELDSIFRLLMLISIYENHVLLNKESDSHQVFADFFKASSSKHDDLEKLRKFLMNFKKLIEMANPCGETKNTDALTLVEFLELDLIKTINEPMTVETNISTNLPQENIEGE